MQIKNWKNYIRDILSKILMAFWYVCGSYERLFSWLISRDENLDMRLINNSNMQ